ncbi:cytochrome P450 monooxygenase [Daldinia caldariorum]|uniref:cytochrome P450 monooxygenase n=1 Tax=Daldinia caldariorum TaxID=326644 RepID=UPI0020077316|nr:cytochrome P450 monooxygenase [Daldinia caldariorum]KAI1469085.1 cytochrome P450 monooxygenase [Daldinia caldariorum]
MFVPTISGAGTFPMAFAWIYPILAAVVFFAYRALNISSSKELSVEKEQALTCDSIPLANRWPLGIDLLTRTLVASDESRVMEFFLDNFRKFGNTYRQVIGWNESLMTIDSAAIEAILSTNSKDWGLGFRRTIFSPLFGDSIFIQEGSAWKHSRDILRPHFYHRNYESLDILRPHVDNLLQVITGAATDVIDLEPLFFHLTLDLTTEFLFGESVGSQCLDSSAASREFEEAFNQAQIISARRLRLQKLYWLVGSKKFRKACNIIHRFVDRVIHNALTTSVDEGYSGRPPFLRSIAQYYPERDTLRGHTISILTAGRDTTASFLSWTFFHLLRHPSVLKKLQSEISQVDETATPMTRADLLRLSYLQNVIKEVLRLHPPLPLISRTAVRDTILPVWGPGGKSPILIPKGMSVLYSSYCIHRRPDIYGMDAEVFRPERWDEEPLRSRDMTHREWTYLPFGGGPRTCLGMDFSLTGGAYTIVRILQRFPFIKLPVGERIQVSGKERQMAAVSLKPADGCKVDLGNV